jgi:hypothetical protein
MDYLDFELEISPGRGREYPVAVIRSPAGEAHEIMRFPYDELALENRLLTLQNALLRSGGSRRRRLLSPEEQAVQDFGKDLFNALIGGEIRSCFDVSRREAHQQGKGLRVKLRFQSPDLACLPWEFLYDHRRQEYLCLSKNTPTIRYLELSQPTPRLRVTLPLRILGMIASPDDLPPLDVARERQRIEKAVNDLQEKGFLALTWLPGQTWRHLQEAMWGGPWHIFHFIGHGGFDPHTDEGLIALANEYGQRDLLTATQVANLLADHLELRLVLLNSCEGARGGKLDIYSSTAAILVRRGISAVLAMQYEITDRAAIEFSRAFYRALAYGLPIDAAVATARIAVNLAVNNSFEWGTPALYMRSPDGVLFELTSLPPPPQPIVGVVEKLSRAVKKVLNYIRDKIVDKVKLPLLAKFGISILLIILLTIIYSHFVLNSYAASSPGFRLLFKRLFYIYNISFFIIINTGCIVYLYLKSKGYMIVILASFGSGVLVGIYLTYYILHFNFTKGYSYPLENIYILGGYLGFITLLNFIIVYIFFRKYKKYI